MGFIRRRIITSIVVFFVAINVDFFLPRFVPGNAAEIFASGTRLPAAAITLLSERFGLDKPLYVQYYLFLKGIVSWPPYFGVSYQYYPNNVSYLISVRLPWTLLLIGVSFLLSFQISYLLAAINAQRRGGKFEFASLYVSILFWSTPAFWIGLVLIWIFAVSLGWLPVFGSVGFDTTSTLKLRNIGDYTRRSARRDTYRGDLRAELLCAARRLDGSYKK